MKTLHYILLFFLFILITTNNNINARKKNKLKRKGRKNNNTKNKNALSYRIQHRISICGLHFEQGRVEDGRKELKQLFTKQSKSFHSKIANEIFPFAIQQHQSGKIHVALELYHFILKYIGNNTETMSNIYANLGLAERDYGNKDNAMKYWTQGLKVDPYHGNILRMTGQMYHEMKYLTSARETYLKILHHEEQEAEKQQQRSSTTTTTTKRKKDPSVLGNLCDLERQLNNIDKAHDYCLKALEINPHLQSAKSSLGAILLHKSKFVDRPREKKELLRNAKKHLGDAITHAPHLTNAWTNYGLIMEQLEEFDKALKSYQKAVLLSPTNPVVYHNIGRYHLMQGNMNEASKFYRNELEHRLKRSTRKCVDKETNKEKKWSIIAHAWRDIDIIDTLQTNKRDIMFSNTKKVNKLKILHIEPETDETYISDEIAFNKTKWHGVGKINDVYMQGRDGILYSTNQCKVYLGGHRYMAGIRNTGLLGLHSFNTPHNNNNMDSTTTSTTNNNNRQDHTIELESFNTITNQKIEYANLISFNSNNYFHFMVETLSRLVLFQTYFKNHNDDDDDDDTHDRTQIKYIVQTTKPFVYNALDLLDVDLKHDIISYDGMDPSVRYFIKDLYIADWFTSSDDTLDDQYVSPTHLFLPPIGLVEKQLRNFILFNDVISSKWKDETMQLLDSNNRPESAETKKRLHLYVGRKLPLKARRVVGERRLIGHMKTFIEESNIKDVHGREPINGEFKLFNGTELSLLEQINIFNKASIVIGPHGAGLTNIMFMKKGSILMEFPVRHAKLLYFKYLALISHIHYYEVKELFTYADLDYEVTDHNIEVVKNYIYSGNQLLDNGGVIGGGRKRLEL